MRGIALFELTSQGREIEREKTRNDLAVKILLRLKNNHATRRSEHSCEWWRLICSSCTTSDAQDCPNKKHVCSKITKKIFVRFFSNNAATRHIDSWGTKQGCFWSGLTRLNVGPRSRILTSARMTCMYVYVNSFTKSDTIKSSVRRSFFTFQEPLLLLFFWQFWEKEGWIKTINK